MRAQIAPNQIGQHGQLQEWLEDEDDPKDKHRHVSHLWGLHPGARSPRAARPSSRDAAKQSLSLRGDGGTGWSQGVEDQLLGAPAWTATTPTRCSSEALSRKHLPEPLRRPPAVPDRRQLRRHRRHRRDAAAEPHRRDRTAPRPALRLADRARSPACAPAAASRWTWPGRTAS